jgi:hypothetical protein
MNPARLLCIFLATLFVSSAGAMEKWLYYPTNLLVEKNVDALEGIWKRAAAAGYTHVMIADSKFCKLKDMEEMPRYFKNIERVKKIAAELKLEVVPALFPVGYSNDILWHDPNLIEAMPVKDQPLVVQGGVARLDDPDAPAIPEGGFTNLKKWGFHDESLVLEGHALHITGKTGNARIFLPLKVQPWRQYHVSVRVKTKDLKGQPEIKVLPEHGDGAGLQWDHLGTKPTQDWTEHHAIFNSQKFTNVSLVFGMWGSNGGELWWDEPKIEEVAFVNLVRRPGAPFVIANADGKILAEGRDFEKLADPLLGSHPWKGEYDSFHEPPLLKISLPDGTKLLASYHHGVTVYDHQATICLSEPQTYDLLRDQARRVHAAWGAKGYFMSHDEIRVMNWCAACEARHLTPGQMLADNVKRCIAMLREVNPGGRIYVWNDMFDPNHNAVKGPYYLVNGPITGSWEGLDKDVIIVPWLFEKRDASLKFFADRGNKQVVAGYYDAKPLNAVDWLTAAKGVPGSVIGAMYTTWQNNYSEMEAFSREMDKVK